MLREIVWGLGVGVSLLIFNWAVYRKILTFEMMLKIKERSWIKRFLVAVFVVLSILIVFPIQSAVLWHLDLLHKDSLCEKLMAWFWVVSLCWFAVPIFYKCFLWDLKNKRNKL